MRNLLYGEEPQGPFEIPAALFGFTTQLTSLFSPSPTSQMHPQMAESAQKSIDSLEEEGGYTVLEAFRWGVANWRLFKEAPIFGHCANLLGIAIVSGFAPTEWSELHFDSVTVWRLTHLGRLCTFV